jgi:hypothetical protein
VAGKKKTRIKKKQTKPKKPTFPKIAATAKVKKCVIGKCADIGFEGLKLAPDQYATVARWLDNEDRVMVTMEQVEAELPFDDRQEPELPFDGG